LGGLTYEASDLAPPESADKVEWDFPHEGKLAWACTLLVASLLALAAAKRRSLPHR
jgi:hypothetical protein